MKKISLIMPVYNAASYLRQNIDSIISQSFTNFELILIDDGSSDESPKIIESFVESDSRVKGIFQTNSGAPSARNKGIKMSTGDYIQFIDSDDYLADNALMNLYIAAEESGADITMGWYDTVDEENHFGKVVKLPLNQGTYTVQDYRYDLSLSTSVPGNKLINANLIKDNNILFTDLKQAQDLNYYLRLLRDARKVTIISEVVYHYRVRQGSISHSYSLVILDTVKSLEDAEKYYFDKNLSQQKLFANLKFKHYSFQFQKIPQIPDKAQRETAFYELSGKINEINRNDLLPLFNGKPWLINKIKMIFKPIYLSNQYTKYQQGKAKKNIVS